MEEIWMNACRNLEISDDIARPWYEKIRLKMVQGSGRFYHNWDELLLRKKDYLSEVSSNIIFAVFFQYYEFDGKRNCVEKNCEAFDEFCSDAGLKNENTVKLVKKLLGDETIDDMPGSLDEVNLLQDLDLMVLGSPPAEYTRYRELLRKEYIHLDDESYKQMRLKTNDNSPSTSRPVLGLQTNLKTPSTSQSPTKTFLRKKPFKKFKDDRPRIPPTNRNTVNLRRTILQQKSQKVLKKIRSSNRKSPLSRTRSQPITADCNENWRNFQISTPKTNTKVFEMRNDIKNEEDGTNLDDDDCQCIEPQPEIILIDDECTFECGASEDAEKSINRLSNYESIGSIRMNQSNIITSTPNFKMIIDNGSSKIELFGNNLPADSTVDSDNKQEDGTLVEKSKKGDVIVIEDSVTSYCQPDATRKRKRLTRSDDSVIFVSENIPTKTTASDFIPLNTPANQSQLRKSPSSTSTPKSKRPCKDFFNSSERKQLNLYNDNAYNPNKDVPTPQTKKRMVIVDGSNVAFNHALNKQFSVKGLKICLDYFEKMGHEVKAVVPQFRLQKQKSSDPGILEKLHTEGKIVFTPCKNLPGKSSSSYDDRFVLQLAAELDAAVVSNDNYRDLINENLAFKKIIENRVIGYTWCNDLFILPKDPYGKWGPTLACILNRS